MAALPKPATREGTRERILDTAVVLLRVRGLKHLTHLASRPRPAFRRGI